MNEPYKISDAILDKLKIMFRMSNKPPEDFKKSQRPAPEDIYPLETKHNPDGSKTLSREMFSPETQKLWDYWLKDCHDSVDSWKNRSDLYRDMEVMFFNSPIVSKAAEIMADEVLQADSNNQPIFIEGKAKVKKFIQKFFDEIGLYEMLRPTVMDIIQFGNAGWILEFDNKGISGIIPVMASDIRDRLEFNPMEIQKKIEGGDSFFVKYRQLDRVDQLLKSISDKTNCSSSFKNHLIGFQIGDNIVPPWKFIHFRNLTNKSPFAPLGIPQFVFALAPYRQYDAAMGLQQVARGARFPKQVYKVNLPNIVSPTEKMRKAAEFLNELQNSGFGTSKKEVAGLNDIIISIRDLFDYEQITPDIDLGKIDDIQMLKDDLINSVFIPRNLLDPNDSAFGDSGVALAEKFKPFARLIYRYQSILMQNITQLVKIHMIYSQEFEADDIDFILSMPYPEAQTNPDLISSQASLLSLANDVIGAIQDKISGGEPLPPELIKSVYNKFLPYDTQTIDDWIDEAAKIKVQADSDQESMKSDIEDVMSGLDDVSGLGSDNTSDMEGLLNDLDNSTQSLEQTVESFKKHRLKSKLRENINIRKNWKQLEESMGKTKFKEAINDTIFEEQQKVIRDRVIRNSHSFSSRNTYSDFRAEDLRKFDQNRLKLMETEEEHEDELDLYTREEVKYEFSFDRPEKTQKKKLKEKKLKTK